ncbi:hypothetical protein PG994_004220 [Apiospora phragmitis]|uniref:Uncharacterized protein n=1 Tax=Apiospora phragmitis TaxID=2905665 RepID=A0ABR1VPZ2_9PEZI
MLKKIHEYHQNARTPIATVIVIDIDYQPKKKTKNPDGTVTVTRQVHDASVSVWKVDDLEHDEDVDDEEFPFKIEKIVDEMVFRQQGQPTEGSLDIPFECYIPLEQRHRIPAAAPTTISISFSDMATALKYAEEDQFEAYNIEQAPEPSPKHRRSNKGQRRGGFDNNGSEAEPCWRTTSHDIAIANAYRPRDHIVTRSRSRAQAEAARPVLRLVDCGNGRVTASSCG